MNRHTRPLPHSFTTHQHVTSLLALHTYNFIHIGCLKPPIQARWHPLSFLLVPGSCERGDSRFEKHRGGAGTQETHRGEQGDRNDLPFLTVDTAFSDEKSYVRYHNTEYKALWTALHVSGPKAPTQFKIRLWRYMIQVFESRKNLRNPLPTSIMQFAGYIVRRDREITRTD